MKITYYRDPFGGYHGVTDESPKGLDGCVCAGRGPDEHGGIETVKERAYAVQHLRKWTRVEDVPDEWLEAIGYEVQSETAPEPLPEPTFEPVSEPENIKLEFAPCKDIIPVEYKKDPVFWTLCIAFFVIYYSFMRYLLT